ncbi:hypothetical protein ATANTOWER_012284 [Ataeniobius toweri]|uniref:Uncharacterized protein n=1 Tax=Ataeniobius toweri TaxID=208326 RepID=A0ABU7CER8_9TELE|nr:hypothetical protein [Ataeniobius toweri]
MGGRLLNLRIGITAADWNITGAEPETGVDDSSYQRQLREETVFNQRVFLQRRRAIDQKLFIAGELSIRKL